ncbi:MAG: hypothetical protein AAGD92_02470 [Pseudomonadota bacterium]
MKTMLKPVIALVLGIAALGMTGAHAKTSSDFSEKDRRSHAEKHHVDNQYDRYSYADAYRGDGVTFSVRFSDRGYYDNPRRYHSRHKRGPRSRILNREVFDTRFRARIVLIEEIVRTRRGPRLICTVKARGPEAYYVPDRRLSRIARRNCSPRARINIYS